MLLQYPGASVLKLLHEIIPLQIHNFENWYFKGEVSFGSQELNRLVHLSVALDNFFTNRDGGAVNNLRIDAVMAEIFDKTRLCLEAIPANSRSGPELRKRTVEEHKPWRKLIPRSCPKTAQTLDALLELADKRLAGDESSAKVCCSLGSSHGRVCLLIHE